MSGMRQLEIRTRRMVNDSLAGEYHSVFKGRGMDFDEVREYSPGDEVRTIDWNVTARAGRPFVKKFTEERELTILLMVDISASGNFGSAALSKRDLAAELASVLAFSAIRNSDKVGPAALHRPRRALSAAQEGPPPCAARGAGHSLPHPGGPGHGQREGARCRQSRAAPARHRVPDFRFPIARRILPSRARNCAAPCARPTGVTISSPCTSRTRARRNLPNVGVLALEDAETGEIIELDTADPGCAGASANWRSNARASW